MTVPPGQPTVDAHAGWIIARVGPSGYRTDVEINDYALIADEPTTVGGSGLGPTPYEFLLAALGSCTAMTLRMYASRKQWPLESVVVRLRDTPPHMKDCEECATSAVGLRSIDRIVELHGPLAPEQRARLMEIADRCPVKQTLSRGIQIRTVE